MTPPPGPMHPDRFDPVAFARSLSDDDMHGVLVALLRTAMERYGETTLIPVDDEAGRPWGYFVPPRAVDALYQVNGPGLTEEEEQELDRRLANPGPTVPLSDAIATLKSRLANLRRQRSAS